MIMTLVHSIDEMKNCSFVTVKTVMEIGQKYILCDMVHSLTEIGKDYFKQYLTSD